MKAILKVGKKKIKAHMCRKSADVGVNARVHQSDCTTPDLRCKPLTPPAVHVEQQEPTVL